MTGKMHNRIILKTVVLLIITVLMACSAYGYDGQYVTADSGLRLRSSYSTESEVLDVIPGNTEVTPFAKVLVGFEEWFKVIYNGITGYVHGDYLENVTTDVSPLKQDMEYLGRWSMTAYTHTGSPCANGNYPTAGYTIACNSLPFGTQVYIVGVGYRTVEDRGPDYLGSSWCDIFYDDLEECVSWGMQYRDIYLVN